MPPRLVVPTDDLFAWTLSGRDCLLTHPDDDPRAALSRDRYALRHLLAQGRHVMAFGATVLGNLLGALAGGAGTDLPGDLPTDPERLHALVHENWDGSAGHRRTLTGTTIPDEDCDRRAAHTLLDVVPTPVLLPLLRWAGQDWRGRRTGWPTHLSWPDPGTPTTGRFSDRPHLVRVVSTTTTLTTAQRAAVRVCQDAGLDVVLLRVNSFGDLPCPADTELGLPDGPAPGCPACRPAVDVDPPAHLLPGERPLPPFLSPGVPEEHHDHHLRAHLARTAPTYTVSDTVAALSPEDLRHHAFALLTDPGAWKGSRDDGRRHLAAAVQRYRDLATDPHLAHEAEQRTEAFRDALTTWHDHRDAPREALRDGEARAALREAATAAGRLLALQGFDVVAVRAAAGAVNRILGEGGAGDPARALRLFRMLSLGITGEELLQMEETGTYPDDETLDFLTVLRG
ncbi:hypothetical protein [Kineococcus sp. SYSU DK003]|uniref:hypothetical protein n=1 Tax=Kineococcus sp. SYSU DK003 TaxID=3383124 RepID=UPI003D7E8CED